MQERKAPQRHAQAKKPKQTADIMPSEALASSADKQEALNNRLQQAAIIGNNTEKLRQLVRAGAEIASKNVVGNTALHFAAQRGHNENCILLIEEYAKSGKDIRELIAAEDNEHRTPRFLAASWWYQDTMQLLDSIPLLQDWMGKESFGSFLSAFRECVAA
jgi:ankyrin repeat protein